MVGRGAARDGDGRPGPAGRDRRPGPAGGDGRPGPASRDALAARLRSATRALAGASLGDAARARLQRRLAAICDAMKVPGADPVRCARRLDLLLAEVARADGAGDTGGCGDCGGHET